jgi:hypothetical protein
MMRLFTPCPRRLKGAQHWLWLLLIFILILNSPDILTAEMPGQFRAGAATSNITPWLGLSINGGMQNRIATHIHDELNARCLALDDGKTQIAIVVVDSCMVPREVFDAAKRAAHEQTGLPADHMLMSATHTHSAPAAASVFQSDADPQYRDFLVRRIADGVRRALNNLAAAKIGWGVGHIPEQVFNRRWKMKPGSIAPNPFGEIDQVKMNPPAGSPDLVEPAGPIDPDVFIVSVQTVDGRPIALLANYSLHYVGGTGRGEISADYFGMFAERIQQMLGAEKSDPPFVGIMSNGTSGNINNIDFWHKPNPQPPYQQMRRVANIVTAEVFRIYQTIEHQAEVSLDARQVEIELAVRLPSAAEVSKAQKVILNAAGPEMKSLEEIYARETVQLNKYPKKVAVLLQALRIGDLATVAIPCEVFVETGLEIKQSNPFKNTFTISLANGYYGYLPTVEHHKLGGYETWRARSSCLEVEAAPKILAASLNLLHELDRAQRIFR